MFSEFVKDRYGHFALISSILAIPLLAAVAGITDFTQAVQKKTQIQDALDAAALAVTKSYRTKTENERKSYAQKIFDINHRIQPKPTFQYSGEIDRWGFVRVEVASTLNHPGMLNWTFWNTTVRSIVVASPREPGCLLALHPTQEGSISFGGSSQTVLKNCVLAANSTDRSSIKRSGAASISAKCAISVGGASGLDSRTNLDCGTPLLNSTATPDPLAGIDPPAFGACRALPAGDPILLSPGTYCNVTLRGNVQLAPGEYTFRGGQIDLGGGGSLQGERVTIFLRENARMRVTSEQTVRISPPNWGDYLGISIYQERGNTEPVTLNGGGATSITGFVYAPSAHIAYRGNASVTGSGECIRIVAATMSLTGNSSISLDCKSTLGGLAIRTGAEHPRIYR